MEWIITYTNSPSNQVNEALRDLGRIEWHYAPQTKNIAVGDTIFLYENAPEKRIRWKCEVMEVNIASTGPSKYFPDDKLGDTAFAIVSIYEYGSSEGLQLRDLADNGCWKIIRGPFRLESVPMLERYIHETEERLFSGGGEVFVSREIPLKRLEKIVKRHASRSPRQYMAAEKRYARNPFVAELAKRRAEGACDLCGSPAPFRDKLGRPYLEAHHIKPLAEGGADSIENVAALCPNCHRKMHSLQERKDIDLLTARAGKE